MKKMQTMTWTRLWRSLVVMMLVLSVALCGCVSADDGKDGGSKPAQNNILLGDGDGRLEAQDAVDSVTNIYGALLGALGGNQKPDTGVEMDLVLTLGDQLKAQLANVMQQADLGSDISWFKNLGVHYTMGYNGELVQMAVDAQLNGKSIVSVEMIMDVLGGMAYVSAPELSNQSIGMEVDMNQMPNASQQVSQMMAEYAEFLKDLPSDKELNAVLTSYLKLAIDTLDAPTTSSKELSCGGITQKVTTTTYSITTYDVLDVATKLLTTAKTDADLEKVLDAFSNVVNQVGAKQAAQEGYTWTDVDLHQQLMEVIDPALENIADSKADSEEMEFLILEVYGDSKTQQGLAVYMNGREYLKLHTLKNGDAFTFYMGVSNGMLQISGEGTTKGNKVNGNYTVSAEGYELLHVEVKEFDTKALQKGELKGTLRLQLGERLLQQVSGSLPIDEDTVIELVLNIAGKTAKMDINIYMDEILLFGIALTTKTGSAGKIKVPSNYINMQDSDAMEDWAQSLKFTSVLSNLRSAGVPDNLVDLLQQALENAMSAGQAYPDIGY